MQRKSTLDKFIKCLCIGLVFANPWKTTAGSASAKTTPSQVTAPQSDSSEMPGEDEGVEEYLRFAKAAQDKNNNAEAIKYYSLVLKINPNHLQARSFRALLYKNTQQFTLAIADYQVLVTQLEKPLMIAFTYGEMAKAFIHLEQYNDAITATRKGLSIEPKAFWLWHYQMLSMLLSDRMPEAEEVARNLYHRLLPDTKGFLLEDIQKFREAGIQHPNFERFEHLLLTGYLSKVQPLVLGEDKPYRQSVLAMISMDELSHFTYPDGDRVMVLNIHYLPAEVAAPTEVKAYASQILRVKWTDQKIFDRLKAWQKAYTTIAVDLPVNAQHQVLDLMMDERNALNIRQTNDPKALELVKQIQTENERRTQRFGVLTLDRNKDKELSTYEGKGTWQHMAVDVSFDADDLESQLEVAEQLWTHQTEWQALMNAAILAEVYDEYLDLWADEESPLSKPDFLKATSVFAVNFSSDGDFDFIFSPDELLCGKLISVSGNLQKGLYGASTF
jgi:hypothetical protein